MLWLAAALLFAPELASAAPPESPAAVARGRFPRRCSAAGTSCVPGPCCRGTRCEDGVCKAPEKKWDDGPNPNEPTPDTPRRVEPKGKTKPKPAAPSP